MQVNRPQKICPDKSVTCVDRITVSCSSPTSTLLYIHLSGCAGGNNTNPCALIVRRAQSHTRIPLGYGIDVVNGECELKINKTTFTAMRNKKKPIEDEHEKRKMKSFRIRVG